MSFAYDDLVTDRTSEDVRRRTAKGVYNAEDLNRVADAVGYVGGMLHAYGYAVPGKPKNDWAVNDIPRRSEIRTHMDAVRGLDVIRYSFEPVTLPASMERLRYDDANRIEKFLLLAGKAAEKIPSAWLYCGELYGGEI